MKLYTMRDIYLKEMKECIDGWEGRVDAAKADYDKYITWVYDDYKLFHVDPKEEHNELCSWCNYLASIRDLGKKNLECMDFDNPNRNDCIDCLKGVKYWFKRLI